MLYDLPDQFYEVFAQSDRAILLESSKCDRDNFRSLLFVEPVEIIEIVSIDQVPGLFARIEQYLERGFYVAGYFTYESGFHCETVSDPHPTNTPIAWFGVYHQPISFDHRTGEAAPISRHDINPIPRSNGPVEKPQISELRLAINPRDYGRTIGRIKDYIRSGDTYQINFTTSYNCQFTGSTLALYRELKKRQRVPYGAIIRNGSSTIVCCSPELFFRRRGNSIVTKPMKGTVRRGRTNDEDEQLRSWLQNDAKNQSENIMIVDLLRNDVGRISELGTVRVSELFSVEIFETLLQMSSTIEGTLRSGIRYFEIFRSLFPCGSVTGAPKIRSMQIINELEHRRRGVYTGAIGYFSPNEEAIFNVAIRTVSIDGESAEMGVGGGIVSDSVAQEEYSECELKAHFLLSPRQEFSLLESLLWDNGYPFITEHVERLLDSARYFAYPCNGAAVKGQLAAHARQFAHGLRYKVRLTIDGAGTVAIEHGLLESPDNDRLRVMIAGERTNSSDRFLYHKTNNRLLYDTHHRQALANGCADAIFLNENGEITEGAISHIFITKRNRLLTPPLSCGLLNGVYRRHVLRTDPKACEQVLQLDDLIHAETIYICNAVRGMREVRLTESVERLEPRGI